MVIGMIASYTLGQLAQLTPPENPTSHPKQQFIKAYVLEHGARYALQATNWQPIDGVRDPMGECVYDAQRAWDHIQAQPKGKATP